VQIEFLPSDPIFQDHFPGAAVVPGSLVVHAALEQLATLITGPVRISRFRFYRFLPPGIYQLRFAQTADKIVCEVFQNHERFAKGSFLRT
jgi:3-hydroxymyristoyl/3-hydroxydecanoyl-(acyl carrier protein) dehydratase